MEQGLSFNSYFYTFMSRMWLSGQVPDAILESEEAVSIFVSKTVEAIGFMSKVIVPEAYKTLPVERYKDSFGFMIYIPLPDCSKDSDAKAIVLMKVGNLNKFFSVEYYGNKFYSFEYTNQSKSSMDYSIDDFSDAKELYFSYTGTSSDFIS